MTKATKENKEQEKDEIRKVIHSLSCEIESTQNLIANKLKEKSMKLRLHPSLTTFSSTFEVEEGSLPKEFYTHQDRNL